MHNKSKDVHTASESTDILSSSYKKLTVTDVRTNEDILIISNGDTPVNIISDNFIVRLSPKYD